MGSEFHITFTGHISREGQLEGLPKEIYAFMLIETDSKGGIVKAIERQSAEFFVAGGMAVSKDPAATRDPNKLDLKGPKETLAAAGFFYFPKAGQIVVMAKLGQLSTGAWWAGIKSATELGKIPATIVQLKLYAEEAEKLLNKEWSAPHGKGPEVADKAGNTSDPVPVQKSPG